MATRNSKKLALSVLGLGAATAAVVFGSWASWTAQTTNPGNTVTSGTLTMTNKKGGTNSNGNPVLTTSVTNIKPGDTNSDTVTIKNTSSYDLSAVKLTISNASGFAGGDTDNVLQVKIHDDTANRCITTDAAGACAGFVTWNSGINLSNFSLKDNGGTTDVWTKDDPLTGPDEAEAHTFTITWNFTNGAAANNASQGKTATFDLTWDGIL